eukprot:g2065.t1
MSLYLGGGFDNETPCHPAPDSPCCIKSVVAYVIGSTKEEEENAGGGADCHSQSTNHWIVGTPISNPMSIYPEYKGNRTHWGINALGTVICEVTLTSGEKGVGVSIGGEPACYIIENHFARYVEGQDINNIELIWDQCWRSSINYGRKGLPLQALSALDLALWDCLGHFRKQPVYNLLGGKTKSKLPCYSTSTRPDYTKKLGFFGGKLPLPYGPADGDQGMVKNIERIKEIRERVGPHFPIMIDCYMSLTVPYAIELHHRIEKEVPFGVKWIEEALHPDDYDGYAELRKAVQGRTLITTGEHEYTRYGFRQLLERKCCDVLQPDITWCGGITEARRICAQASAYDIPVIPHGSSVYSYHLQFAFTNCPIAEFLNMSPKADTIVPYFGDLFVDEPLPKDGFVRLDDPKKYGFGVTLNREKLNLRRPCPHEPLGSDLAAIHKVKNERVPTKWLTKKIDL